MRIVNIRLTRTDKEELNMEKIIFQSDDGTAAEFYVEEQTNIAGVTYLLVSDSHDEEADAYILKDISAPGSTEACYEMVEDDDELQAVYAVFQQMLDDVNFEWRSDFFFSLTTMTTKMRRAEYKFPQAVPEEPQQDKRMPDQEQDSIVVAAKTVRISLSGQQQRKQQPVAL